ncbi:MAG: hypothetical protein JXR96_03545 [Deltaproteobacteria bacterium]|nr:hypothetical protein [Deltaproteobacteria bacterium]
MDSGSVPGDASETSRPSGPEVPEESPAERRARRGSILRQVIQTGRTGDQSGSGKIGLVLVGMWMDFWLLYALALFALMRVPTNYRLRTIAEQLKAEGLADPAELDEQTLLAIDDRIERVFSIAEAYRRDALVLQVAEMIALKPPSAGATAGLIMAYLSPLLVGFVLVVVLFVMGAVGRAA